MTPERSVWSWADREGAEVVSYGPNGQVLVSRFLGGQWVAVFGPTRELFCSLGYLLFKTVIDACDGATARATATQCLPNQVFRR